MVALVPEPAAEAVLEEVGACEAVETPPTPPEATKVRVDRAAEYAAAIQRTDMWEELAGRDKMTLLQLSKKIEKYGNQVARFEATPGDRYSFNTRQKALRTHLIKVFHRDTHLLSAVPDCVIQFWCGKSEWFIKQRYFPVPLAVQYFKTIAGIVAEMKATHERLGKVVREHDKVAYNAHQNEQVACECGGHYSRRNKQKHLATTKHKAFGSAQTVPTVQEAVGDEEDSDADSDGWADDADDDRYVPGEQEDDGGGDVEEMRQMLEGMGRSDDTVEQTDDTNGDDA